MKTIILNLRGLQSWGSSNKHVQRETRGDPTFSGVIGMICSGAGVRPESDEAAEFRGLSMAVRVQLEGRKLCDYQTARGFRNIADISTALNIQVWKYYLSDACFLVALSGKNRVIESVEKALTYPKYHLYLGRMAFPPCSPIVVCTMDGSNPHKALLDIKNDFLEERGILPKLSPGDDSAKRYVVLSKSPSVSSEKIKDMPTSDGYAVRIVDHVHQ